MDCPNCNEPAQRSETLIPGHVCYRCPKCEIFGIEGSGRWLPQTSNLQERLLAAALRVEEDRNVVREVMTSPDDDPRWRMTTLY